MKIYLSEPDGPYGCEIDTGVMDVKLCDVFTGVKLQTTGLGYQEVLHISMRDNGFEVRYVTHDFLVNEDHAETTDIGWFEFKDGKVSGPVVRP